MKRVFPLASLLVLLTGCLVPAAQPTISPPILLVETVDAPGVEASLTNLTRAPDGLVDADVRIASALPIRVACALVTPAPNASLACPETALAPGVSATWRLHAAPGEPVRVIVFNADASDAEPSMLHARLVNVTGKTRELLILDAPATNATLALGQSNLTLRAYRVAGDGRAVADDGLMLTLRTYMPLHGHYGYKNTNPTLLTNGTYEGVASTFMAGLWELRIKENELGTSTWLLFCREVAPRGA